MYYIVCIIYYILYIIYYILYIIYYILYIIYYVLYIIYYILYIIYYILYIIYHILYIIYYVSYIIYYIYMLYRLYIYIAMIAILIAVLNSHAFMIDDDEPLDDLSIMSLISSRLSSSIILGLFSDKPMRSKMHKECKSLNIYFHIGDGHLLLLLYGFNTFPPYNYF